MSRANLLTLFFLLAACLTMLPGKQAARAEQPPLPPAVDRKIDFAKDVEPIFAAHCYKCHGEKKQESALRLDQREAALKGGDVGRDIVPGDSAASPLIQAVAGISDSISEMPENGEKLSDEQIGILRAWIDQGANYPQQVAAEKKDRRDHWAFKPPVRPDVPRVRDASWPRNEIDYFILARLEQEGLGTSPPADRITLLRRLSLDLIGLPPTVAEIDAFVADTRPDAYERQVERLLSSPHYGERWGRYWLDAARYSDSDGFEKDKSRSVWFYRDWVVNAFNRDLPYNQFIIEQLAGDQLPGATQDQVVATGFLRNSMHNEEGGIDPEQFRMDAMYDRMDAVGKSMLGVTIQCCQCHNHKYDPITQEEYYRLFAYLNNDYEAQVPVYSPPELQKRDELVRDIRQLEAELQRSNPDWQQRMAAWEEQAKASEVSWEVLNLDEYGDNNGGAKLLPQDDKSLLNAGFAPAGATFFVKGKTPLTNVTALRLEVLRHADLPRGGPGRSYKGTFGLTEIKIEAAPADAPDKKAEVKVANATADFEQPESELEKQFDNKQNKKRVLGPAKFATDGKDDTAWGIDTDPGRQNQDRKAVFQFEKPVSFPVGAVISASFVQGHGGWNSDDHHNNLLGRFRVSVTQAPAPVVADPLPLDVRAILAIPRDKRTPGQAAAVFSYWRTTVPAWSDVNNKIEALWRQWPLGTTSLVLQAREMQRQTHVLKRGDFLSPLAEVAPGVPDVFNDLPPDATPTRLSLARWLVARDSPTPARVYVNRVWQAYFGTGIVSTSEDIGVQSDPPSHPQLLDWLACEFMDSGWSIKHLHRLITMSATYHQISACKAELYAADPFNRLLARGARQRVEGEIVRDISLASSGLLNPKLGGPSVFPPIPESLLTLSFAPVTWNEATGEDRYRRALYTFRRRSLPYPILQNFDTPNGDASCVRRTRSNTPLQALTTLNETVFMECARELARRALTEGGASDADRIAYAFRRCVSRPPTKEETAELMVLLEQQRARIADGWLNTREILSGKNEMPAEMPNGATPTQFAAYTLVARVLLNLDETMTKE